MMKRLILGSCLVFLSLGLTACGSDSDDGPAPTPTPNPIAMKEESFQDGPGGNLWKAVSENNGNIVVLLNPIYRSVFSKGCTIERADGTFETLYCGFGGLDCFTNPDRLTLRSNLKCGNAKEVKVVCEEDQQIVTFTVAPELRNQVCTRFD